MIKMSLILMLTLVITSCGKSGGGGGSSQGTVLTDNLGSSKCQISGETAKEVAISGYESLEHCSDEEFAAEVRD